MGYENLAIGRDSEQDGKVQERDENGRAGSARCAGRPLAGENGSSEAQKWEVGNGDEGKGK